MLRVVGRRADGYHLVQTVFRFIDHGDEVRVSVRADGVIRRLHAITGVNAEDDLTMRAARLLKLSAKTPLGADIELVKRLPLGGGLGGGSSDAATVLLALNRLWNTGLSRDQLQALGLKLGADVPVFLFGETAFAEGIGELLTPIDAAPAWYVVLTPPVCVSTAEIFAHADLKRDSKPIKIHDFSTGATGNDLEPLVSRLYPEVARHIDWLRQWNSRGPALMSGSGASVFAAFDHEPAAQAVLASLPRTMSGFVAQGLDRHPLWALAQ